MNAWRLLLTRPAEECRALAAELAQQDVYSSSLPLLTIEALAPTSEQHQLLLNLDAYTAVIVVSKPAARLVLERLRSEGRSVSPQQPWFSVGSGTGQLLLDQGLTVYWPAVGDDSEALLQLPALCAALAVTRPRVLIIRGEGGRELLAEQLQRQGAHVDHLVLYRRVQPNYPLGTLTKQVRTEQLNGLVLSSGQSLANLVQLAAADWPGLARLPLFVPSVRVAELAYATGAQQVIDCRGASAEALLAALQANPAAFPQVKRMDT